jgi:hypothetical protein
MTEDPGSGPPAITRERTSRPPPARGWIVLTNALVGLQIAATLAVTTLFLFLAFDPRRDMWGQLFLVLSDGAALIGGLLLGFVPSLLLDRRCGMRFGRRSRIAALCVVLILAEFGVAELLHWGAVC